MSRPSLGQIITFYSYKGGTGRSMALANVACVLAERLQRSARGVLMVDWDLEAPGLHRYFAPTSSSNSNPFSTRGIHSGKLGLIDLFYEIQSRIRGAGGAEEEVLAPQTLEEAAAVIRDVELAPYISPTAIRGLSLIQAGNFDTPDPNSYAERVNKFNWEHLYLQSPHIIRMLAEKLASEYEYVLIDSRTGVTDISGICTTLLPEKLVVVFTPNQQSIQGALDIIQRATEYRKESADLRPLMIFPLVSRVEANQPDLRHEWRFGNPDTGQVGFQPEFERILRSIYSKSSIRLSKYFDEVQIQHVPRYAYGEKIAILVEETGDKFSLQRSYRGFAQMLVASKAPWEGEGSATETAETNGIARAAVKWHQFSDAMLRRYGWTAPLLIASTILTAVLASQTFRHQRELNRLLVQNEVLEQQLRTAEQPLSVLAQQRAQIDTLYAQVASASAARDSARQELLLTRRMLADYRTRWDSLMAVLDEK